METKPNQDKCILLVEDSPVMADRVHSALEPFGFRVTWVQDGADVPSVLRHDVPDLIILDVMLAGAGLVDVCRDLRSNPATAHLPILMLTAQADEMGRGADLELGADDVLTKPFDEGELLDRVRTLLRRAAQAASPPVAILRAGPITLDPNCHEAYCAGTLLELTPTEFKLLHALLSNVGYTQTRESLLNQVWDHDWYGDPRVVDTHIQHLRRKLRWCMPNGGEDLIIIVQDVGYRIDE